MKTFKELTSYENNEFLNECVIAAKKFDDCFVYAKNRDRPYNPSLTLIHDIVNGVEMVYMIDNDTDWSEGMNEYGMCVINSALMITRDEAEKKKSKDSGKPLKDGSIIREALKLNNVQDIINLIVNKDGGLKGHTYVGTANEMHAIEYTSHHEPDIEDHTANDNIIRTNHGIKHSSAGYQNGLSFKSSAIRKNSAIIQVSKAESPEDVLRKMRKRLFKKDSMLNMKRDTNKLWTSSQLLLDPRTMTVKLIAFSDKTTDVVVDNRLPDGYTPKLKLKLEII